VGVVESEDVTVAGGAPVLVQRSADRFVTRTSGLDSRHCFSFGQHYDPANVAFGGLLALNDDCVAPGAGYPPHPHAGLDLVSWVVSGGLRHEHGGTVSVVRPGGAQLLATGAGVRHSEVNAGTDCLRFIQMWLVAEDRATANTAAPVRYESAHVEFDGSPWVQLAGGSGSSAPLRSTSPRAAVFAARWEPGDSPDWPVAAWAHLFVVAGQVRVTGQADLCVGDSLRALSTEGIAITAIQPSEVLLVSAPPTG